MTPTRRRGALLAAALLTASCAASLTLAAPAQAVEVCTVNGAPAVVVNGVINGTSNDDIIVCVGLALEDVDAINGLGGNHIIRLTDVAGFSGTVDGGDGDDVIEALPFPFLRIVRGVFLGGPGNDRISVGDGSLTGGGRIEGGAGNDRISGSRVSNYGVVRGGTGTDEISFRLVSGRNSVVDGEADGDTISMLRLSATTVHGGGGADLIEGVTPGTSITVTDGGFVRGDAGSDTCRTFPANRNDCELH